MRFDPVRATQAAASLDHLADRLEGDLHTNAPMLTVPPAALDEVSTRAAQTMNEVAVSYGDAAHAGVRELRNLAAAVRGLSAALVQMDAANAADFRRV